jgi:hypothetical protein
VTARTLLWGLGYRRSEDSLASTARAWPFRKACFEKLFGGVTVSLAATGAAMTAVVSSLVLWEPKLE